MSDDTALPLPPGRFGLPLLGETLAFLSDSFGFVRSRMEKHGPLFRTSILGQPTAVMAGPEACAVWLDPELVERHKSMPAPVHTLFGGDSLPLLDGDAHRARKTLVMAGFSREALASYVPVLDETVRAYFEAHAGRQPEALLPDLKALAIEGIGAAVLGFSKGEALSALLADYNTLTRGFTGLPVNLSFTAFGGAVRARDRILAALLETIRAHRKEPTQDALSRMLAARAGDVVLTDEEAALEVHHVVLAGLIIFAEFAATLGSLAEHPAVLARLRDEVDAQWKGPTLQHGDLARMPYLLRVVQELKRTCPNVPVSFGKAKKDFVLHGVRVPAGWNVFLSVTENNRNRLYTEVDRFDPDRFEPGRAEHEKHAHAYVPQGPGPELGHRCAGLDFSTVFMELFAARLVRDYDWTLELNPPQLRFDLIPPEPREGLVGRYQKRA